MYTRKQRNSIKYIYLKTVDGDRYMNLNDFKKFESLFCNSNPTFVFDYNCLEHPHIFEMIEYLIDKFRHFVVRCDKCRHIDIYESKRKMIPDFRVKIDPKLSLERIAREINNNTMLYNYIKDLNKDYLFDYSIDLYVNKSNIHYLKQTIKTLTHDNFKSRVLFEEYAHNGFYNLGAKKSSTIDKYDIDTNLLMKDIVEDRELMIVNRENIIKMLDNYMCFMCWKYDYAIQICLNSDFKLQLCNKINYEINLNPLECFDSDGQLKEDIWTKFQDEYKKCCFGCTCEDFVNEAIRE